MKKTIKERKFSGSTCPEIQPWETEHRALAKKQQKKEWFFSKMKIMYFP